VEEVVKPGRKVILTMGVRQCSQAAVLSRQLIESLPERVIDAKDEHSAAAGERKFQIERKVMSSLIVGELREETKMAEL
jgi:hypothetical protein